MVKINSAFFIICSLLPLLLSGCSLTERSASSTKPSRACMTVSAGETDVLTAEKHYEYMVSCAKNKQLDMAAVHYAIAGVLTWHDYLASPDEISKQRHQAQLRKHMTQLSDHDKRLLWQELNIALHDEKRLNELCATIVLPQSNKREKMLWQEAKNGYLHCVNDKFF